MREFSKYGKRAWGKKLSTGKSNVLEETLDRGPGTGYRQGGRTFQGSKSREINCWVIAGGRKGPNGVKKKYKKGGPRLPAAEWKELVNFWGTNEGYARQKTQGEVPFEKPGSTTHLHAGKGL